MPEATTRGVRVHVESAFVPENSDIARSFYFFRYHVTISNAGSRPVQLISRHWIITDGNGVRQEVQGPGVVGEQPLLSPGKGFSYTSFCPLRTPVGFMEGTYQMVTSEGETFDAAIPAFTLANPLDVA